MTVPLTSDTKYVFVLSNRTVRQKHVENVNPMRSGYRNSSSYSSFHKLPTLSDYSGLYLLAVPGIKGKWGGCLVIRVLFVLKDCNNCYLEVARKVIQFFATRNSEFRSLNRLRAFRFWSPRYFPPLFCTIQFQ